MSDGVVLRGNGTPPHEGIYAVEITFGWKLLEWRKGGWWFGECTAPWKGDIPAQWVGPLPARAYSHKPKVDFDL